MALSALQNGDEAMEMRLYNAAAKADPFFAPPYYNMGKTYEERGELEEAKRYYLKAIEIQPDYVEALEQMAIILETEGRIEEATEYFRSALKINPYRTKTYEHIVWFAKKTKQDNLIQTIAAVFKHFMPREFNKF